jgi:hypothetical protein
MTAGLAPGTSRSSSCRADDGTGSELKTLVTAAESELTGHPSFPSGRFTNWIRFVKVDLECEGVLERVGRSSPQRVRLVHP